MKRTKQDKILSSIYFTFGVIGIIIIFTHCSAVKRVNKSESKQLKVIENYKKKHPAKNDTTYIYTPGDTVKYVSERLDTLYMQSISDTVNNYIYKTLPIVKTVTEVIRIRDTFKITETDRTYEGALQKIINTKEEAIINTKVNVSELKHSLDKWKFRFFILLAINTLFLAWRIKKFFSPI